MTKQSKRLLEQALPSIERTARRLAAVYRPAHYDAGDLMQIGALAVAEALHRGIHPRGNKRAYVIVIAQRAMRRELGVYKSLIRTPRTANGFQPARVVLSLDMPLFPGEETTLLDRLANAALDAAEEYAARYECYCDELPEEAEE